MNENVKKYFKGDAVIWGVIIALSIISLLAVYSSIGTYALKQKQGDIASFIVRHFTFLFIGIVIIYVTHLIPYKYYSRLSQLFVLISIPLLGLTLVFGREQNEANRFLELPFLGFTFQTSDFAKLALIMYLARLLSLKQEEIKDFKKAFVPLILPVALVCLLILPANFSTAAILFVTCILLMFIGRVNYKHLLKLAAIGIALFALYVAFMFATGKQGRIVTWWHRIEVYIGIGDSKVEENSQVEKAQMAIADGGFLGKGPGNSIQRNFLAQSYSDFIYAIIVEEYGLFGGIVVIILYLWLMFRAGVIVRKLDRTFPAFLAIGLILLIVFQAMVNMAVATSLFPVTGQTLPLVSRGGTSILFTCFALGIVLNISRGPKIDSLEPITNEEENNTNTNESDKNFTK